MTRVSNMNLSKMVMITGLALALALNICGLAQAASWNISADESLSPASTTMDFESQALLGTWDRIMVAEHSDEVVRISLYANGVGRLTTLDGTGTTVQWHLEGETLVLEATDNSGSASFGKGFRNDGTLALSSVETGAQSTWYKNH